MRNLLCLLIALPLAVPAQAPESTIKTTTSEVLLDFVARDKSAHVIHDLRPDEVQILEDGVPQTVKHFEFYDGRNEAPNGPAATGTDAGATKSVTVNALRDISVVSIVISSLDPRGRKLTQAALQEFVKNELKPSLYVGVFSLGMSGLRSLQSYTNDGAKITAAVQNAVDSAATDQLNALDQEMLPDFALGSASGRFASTDYPTDIGNTSGDIASGGSDIGGGTNSSFSVPLTGGAGDQALANELGPTWTASRILSTRWAEESEDVYSDSTRFLGPLGQLAQAQAGIPGRKVILLFSAGLPMQNDTVEQFNKVISDANRANVSIYVVDPRGFTEQSDLENSKRLLMAATEASKQQMLVGSGTTAGDATVRTDAVMSGEIAESSIHADTRGNLTQLAVATGGAMLPASLDMREPLRDALEDVRTHYELTYSPANSAADGSFRKIEVKVLRPGVKVFAREGYYALPILNGQQLYPFEIATMKAINTTPDLHQFEFRSATMEFRPGAQQNQYAYVFQAPTRDLGVVSDKQWAKVHVCVTALVKDDKGQVVDKISKDIPYDVPVDKKEALEKGIVSFAAPFELPPGHYTVETAAVDRQSMKASVSRTSLDVPPPTRFAMSDVAVARRVDGVQGLVNADDPLEAHGGKVTPDLSDTVYPDASGAVKFYAVAYAPALSDAPVLMRIEVWRDGKLVMRSPGARIPTDPRGAASVLASVPVTKLGTGHFETRISFQYNGQLLTRKVDFTLADVPQISSK
jgi:VWFA-related protein